MANPVDLESEQDRLRELQGLLDRAQLVEQSLQRPIPPPKAKAKVASRNPADYARNVNVNDDEIDEEYGFQVVMGENLGSMTDASKRLHDDDSLADVSVGPQVVTLEQAAAPMNRVRRALVANNTEAVSFAAGARMEHTEARQMGVAAKSGDVPRVERTLHEALSAANPEISVREAQMLYPSVALDGSGYVATPKQTMGSVAKGSGKAAGRPRYTLTEDHPSGLRTYVHFTPPSGRVREMWHFANPINDDIPMPHGVSTMAEWGSVVVTMDKFKGATFRQILDAIISGDREVQKYAGWIISRYGAQISRNPPSQAPDLAAYLLRSGWGPDQRAPPITYIRTYSSYTEA